MEMKTAQQLLNEMRNEIVLGICEQISQDILSIVIDNYEFDERVWKFSWVVVEEDCLYHHVWDDFGLSTILDEETVDRVITKFEKAGFSILKKYDVDDSQKILYVVDISWDTPKAGRKSKGVHLTATEAKEQNKIATTANRIKDFPKHTTLEEYIQKAYQEFVEHLNESINQGKSLEIYEYETDMPIKMIDKFIDKWTKLGYTVNKEYVPLDDEGDTGIKTLTIALPIKENENDV